MAFDRKAYNRIYTKAYHAKHSIARNLAAKEKRRVNKMRCVEYFGDVCNDCGQSFPHYVYDFHHLDPSVKEMSVGNLLNWNWGRQQEELEKCVMLCANCHRIRHHGELVGI